MNTKMLLLFVFFFFNLCVIFAQDTIYYNSKREIVLTKKEAFCYEVISEKKDSLTSKILYVGKQYNVNDNELRVIRHYADKDKKTLQGLSTSFYSSGRLGDYGMYENNKKEGTWKHYHESGKISALLEYKYDEIVLEKYYNEDGSENTPHESMRNAQYEGGKKAFNQFLEKNVRYPKEAEKKEIQGKVMVEFVVDIDGSLEDIKIQKSVHKLLDDEALRVINLSPRWKPAKQFNRACKQRMVIPINFSSK